MKSILIAFCVLSVSLTAFAVPRSVHLVAPEKIRLVKDKVELTLSLTCKNQFPDEWAGQLVVVSDDEGDMAMGLGVVIAKSSCDRGPVKKFVLHYPITELGVSSRDELDDVDLQPIDLAD